MTTPEPIPDINHRTEASTKFHHFVGGFVIGLPCIISNDNTVFVHDDYTLIDFTDNGGFIDTAVRLFDAFLRGYEVTVVLLESESGELIKRKHRLGNDDLPCNWILTDFFNPKDRKDDLLEFCFLSKPEMNDNIISIPDAYISDHRDSYYLDREFILTQGKNLVTGMTYLYTKGNRTTAVRLMGIQVVDGIVYFKLQELKSNRSFTVNWNLGYDGSYYLWSLADLPTLRNQPK